MTSIKGMGASAFRDYVTDGEPTSGVHQVAKASVRTLMGAVDALANLAVISATTAAQPGSPSAGDAYIIPAGATGDDWAEMSEGSVALYEGGAWIEIEPREGFTARVKDTNDLVVYTGAAWLSFHTDDARKLLFTPGGDGVISIYRIDTTRVQNPRTATISSVAGDVITLTTTDAGLFFANAVMAGVSYVRIWNTSKDPDESAWVKAQPANNQLQVVNAAAISGWANGETIQIGDPTAVTPNRCIALDISPMMQAVLGRVFRQKGVLCKMLAIGIGAQTTVGISENGANGSFANLVSGIDGSLVSGQNIIPCSELSPVSNSNLVFMREVATGTTMSHGGVSVVGVLV